ncbi:MAG: hypothetical protein MRZ90_00140 [Candidatus Gastranaerophilales bacterium]|nr:hypothetical protein [Candidatus Gastranaerophilales bacterium]
MQQIKNTRINVFNNTKSSKTLCFKSNEDNQYVSVRQSNIESLKVPLVLGMLASHCTFLDKSKEQLKSDLKSLKNKTLGNGFNVIATIGTIIIACGLSKTIADYYNNKKQTVLKLKKENNETNEKAIKRNLVINTIIQSTTVFVSNFLFGCFNIKNNRKMVLERSGGFALMASAVWAIISTLSNYKTLKNYKNENQ